jgi:hypothetical protein
LKHLPINIILLLLLTCAKEDSQDPGTTPSNIVPKYTLTVSAGEGGSVSTAGGTYNSGTSTSITATPKLTGTSPSSPSWAPDSQYLAFSWSEPGNSGRGLWVSTNDGKEVRLVSNIASASVRDIVWVDANTVISLRGNNL